MTLIDGARSTFAIALLAATFPACDRPAANPPATDRPGDSPVVEYRSPAGVEYTAQADTGAVAAAEAALAADPGNVDLILALGLAQSGIRQYREAIETFTRGIEIQPDNPVLYRWRGHRHLSIREFDLARADLEHALTLDSTLYGAWYHLGIVRFVSAEFEAAADAFTHALPFAPDPGEHAGSIDWGWMSLSRAGRTEQARQWLEMNDDSIPIENAYTSRLRLYRGEIGPDELITPADTADVQAGTLNYGLGNWYLIQGDTAQAMAAFERSIRSGGWPAFGFIASEAELRRLAGS